MRSQLVIDVSMDCSARLLLLFTRYSHPPACRSMMYWCICLWRGCNHERLVEEEPRAVNAKQALLFNKPNQITTTDYRILKVLRFRIHQHDCQYTNGVCHVQTACAYQCKARACRGRFSVAVAGLLSQLELLAAKSLGIGGCKVGWDCYLPNR